MRGVEARHARRVVSQSFDIGSDYPREKTVEVDGRSVYLWTTAMKQSP